MIPYQTICAALERAFGQGASTSSMPVQADEHHVDTPLTVEPSDHDTVDASGQPAIAPRATQERVSAPGEVITEAQVEADSVSTDVPVDPDPHTPSEVEVDTSADFIDAAAPDESDSGDR